MSNIKNRTKFERLDNTIWQKSKVDGKGRTVLPLKLRRKLGLNGGSVVLWIQVDRVNGKANEYDIRVGVKH